MASKRRKVIELWLCDDASPFLDVLQQQRLTVPSSVHSYMKPSDQQLPVCCALWLQWEANPCLGG